MGIVLGEFRGVGNAAHKYQVFASLTDAKEFVGRKHAAANNLYNEVRITLRGNYLGAFDIVPSIGFYQWGIPDSDLKRQLGLNGKRMICREARHEVDSVNGVIQTSVILEPEAFGPDGIDISQGGGGNYPTAYPSTPSPPAPSWAVSFSATAPALLVAGSDIATADYDGATAALVIASTNELRQITYPDSVSTATTLDGVNPVQSEPWSSKIADDYVLVSFIGIDGGPVDTFTGITSQAAPPGLGSLDSNGAGTGERVYNCYLGSNRAIVANSAASAVYYYSLNPAGESVTEEDNDSHTIDDLGDVIELDASNAVLIGAPVGGGNMQGHTLTISAGLIVLGGLTTAALNIETGSRPKGAPITNSTILVGYEAATSNNLNVAVVSRSGANLTAGTPLTVAAGAGATPRLVRIGSTNTYLVVWTTGGGTFCQRVAVSGTTVTLVDASALTIDAAKVLADAHYYTDGADKVYCTMASGGSIYGSTVTV